MALAALGDQAGALRVLAGVVGRPDFERLARLSSAFIALRELPAWQKLFPRDECVVMRRL
jgi:hypothetical protein